MSSSPNSDSPIEISDNEDLGARLLKGLVKQLLRMVESEEPISAAEGELVRKLCESNSVSLSSIRRGDFGATAQRAAESFPFETGTAGNA